MELLASLRRVLAVARTTARDLGGECSGVLLVLVGGLWLFAPADEPAAPGVLGAAREAVSQDAPGGDRWGLLEAMQHWVAGACLAAVLVAAWSVDRDRRHGRWSWWWTTPLRSGEYVLGKWLGLWGCTAAVTLLLAALGLALDADARSSAVLSPPQRQVADAMSLFRRGGAMEYQAPDPVLLATVDARVLLEFRSLPEGASPRLEVRLKPWNYELRDGRGPPELRVVDGRGEILAEQPLPGLRGPFRIELPGAVAPLQVAIKPGSFQRVMPTQPGGLRVLPQDVVLLGGPTPATWTLGHLAGAWVLLLGWTCALVVAAATLLGDLLAATAAGVALALAFGRAFLLDVTAGIADPAGPASWLARSLARATAGPVRLLPDLEAWLGLRERALGVPVAEPWALPYAPAAVGAGIALAAATAVLALLRRRR